MSSFKEILDGILNNTEVTIGKNGIGIKNENFSLNIPGNSGAPQLVVGNELSMNQTPISNDEYEVRAAGISGIHDVFGGLHFTVLMAKNSVMSEDIENLWRKIPELYSTASIDSAGNRIRFMKDDKIAILSVEIPCQVYNKHATFHRIGETDIDIIREFWVRSISNAIKLPMSDIPNVDRHIKRIGDFLMMINDGADCRVADETIWFPAITTLCTYFAEMGRSHIGRDIADCENLSYVPEVPEGTNVGVMKKYPKFFDDADNLNRCVKLSILSTLLPPAEGRF